MTHVPLFGVYADSTHAPLAVTPNEQLGAVFPDVCIPRKTAIESTVLKVVDTPGTIFQVSPPPVQVGLENTPTAQQSIT